MKLKNNSLNLYRLQLLIAMIILVLNDYLRHAGSPLVLCLLAMALLLTSFNRLPRPWQGLNWGIQLLAGPFLLSNATGSLLELLAPFNVIGALVALCYLVAFLPYAELFVKPLKGFWLRFCWVIFFSRLPLVRRLIMGLAATTGIGG